MKFSPKQLLVREHTKSKMVWFGQFCKACNHKVMFETMFVVDGVFYCMDCCPTKESAFDASFPKTLTPSDIILRRDREKVRQIIHDLLDDIDNLKDGEVSPSVYSVLLKYSPDVLKLQDTQ